ncbi:MAG: 4Fe-4S binding protein, partial [Rhodospirillales bacterium]|nr:4Fe-4S binding protein [Rhodospirillales bacterium]
MIVAIASGKGGTGKTTFCAALASVWPTPLAAADLDVEAPNLHLFLEPDIDAVREARIEVPKADPERCTGCGDCARACQFRAIAVFGSFPAVFPDLCHGCGGCFAVCPTGALAPHYRVLGTVEQGRAGDSPFLMGRLRIGE